MSKTVAWLDEHNKVVVLESYRGGGFVREDGAIPESWKPLSTTDFRDPAKAAALAIREDCAWTYDEDGFWNTQCGHAWSFDTGGPKENGAKFCMYCGGNLVAAQAQEETK